jgi:V8-like Glu-specific endopeptidase
LITTLLACACVDDVAQGSLAPPQAATEETRLPVIYGDDDRQEVFDYPLRELQRIARRSLVALVAKERIRTTGHGDQTIIALEAESLGDAMELCDSERFAAQPSAATCSGILIAPDLLLTAGHCFDDEQDCERYAYVFDYLYGADGELETIDASDISSCKELVVRRLSAQSSALREDFAVVRLAHPLETVRRPVALRRGPVRAGERVTVLGFPGGVPAKVDDGGLVRSARASVGDYFALDSDTFHGSSGSGVFDAQYRLAGVLVRGGRDYLDMPDAGCAVARTVSDVDGEPWEQATYVTRVLDVLCEHPERAPSLCETAPVCGDGVCERVEAAGDCPADCLDMCALSLCKPRQESSRRFSASTPAQDAGSNGTETDNEAASPSGSCSALAATQWKRANAWPPLSLGILAWLLTRRRRN